MSYMYGNSNAKNNAQVPIAESYSRLRVILIYLGMMPTKISLEGR